MLAISTLLFIINTIVGFFCPIFWIFGILNLVEIVAVIKMITKD